MFMLRMLTFRFKFKFLIGLLISSIGFYYCCELCVNMTTAQVKKNRKIIIFVIFYSKLENFIVKKKIRLVIWQTQVKKTENLLFRDFLFKIGNFIVKKKNKLVMGNCWFLNKDAIIIAHEDRKLETDLSVPKDPLSNKSDINNNSDTDKKSKIDWDNDINNNNELVIHMKNHENSKKESEIVIDDSSPENIIHVTNIFQ